MALIAGAQAAEVSPSRLTGILPLRTDATIRTVTATIRDVVRYVQSRARSPQSRRGRARRRYPDVGGVGLLCGPCMPAGSRPLVFLYRL